MSSKAAGKGASCGIGKPIPIDHLEPDAATDELLISRLTEDLRSQIQLLVETGLANRESIWG